MIDEPQTPIDAPQEVPKEQPVEQPENRSGVPTIPQLMVALALLLTLLGAPHLLPLWHSVERQLTAEEQGEVAETPQAPAETADPFSDVALEADAAYVWDVSAQKALYAKNAHAQLPLASLTKLMTGLIAYETYDKTKPIRITLDAVMQDGENGLEDGDTWKAGDLLGFTMISSSNDGAYALAAAAGAFKTSDGEGFIDHMNAKARELGLAQTYFTNPTGLDTSTIESGSYGSARDMAFLMEHIIKEAPQVVAGTTVPVATFRDEAGETHTATNTNQAIEKITNALGSKTGYTELAGGNLVVAFDAGLNHPIVIAVLGSSREGRFTDVEQLLERTKRALIAMP
jgi:serine-type D-Ala-D-Ala carboxypeptidase (penicillin-binding protein 5/6)